MADLSMEHVSRFVELAAARIAEISGLAGGVAREAAVSLIPPFDREGGLVLLRDAAGAVVASIREEDLAPYDLLERSACPPVP